MSVLEIGPGDHPEVPGSMRLDIRPDVPDVTWVQSAVDLSNLDATFDRVLARDVVEHLPWRDVPKALSEWLRVTAKTGCLEVETPNAFELADLIAKPGKPHLQRWEHESDWARFCRVAFGHQDYPGNFHASYFTPQWLTDLLYQAGAEEVEEVFVTPLRFRLRATK